MHVRHCSCSRRGRDAACLPSPPQIESQRRQVEMALRRAAFTAAQLDDLPDDTRTYRSVGKA